MENNVSTNRNPTGNNNTNNTSTAASSSTNNSGTNSATAIRQSHKRTFSESDSSSRTERHLCSFSHLWIINYLSSYLDDPNSNCLQSESFSPVNTPYSNTRWSLKLYPRGLNEKQHSNNNLAIFLKYISGTMPTIKAKAEFSVVSRNNELVMLRSTAFHTFSSGNDWGYSEFLDGNYLNSRRNDLLTDDRLRVYVRVILVDEKDTMANDLTQGSFHNQQQASVIHPSSNSVVSHPTNQTAAKSQPSTSASSASSSTALTGINRNSSTSTSSISLPSLGLFSNEKERYKSFELLSSHLKSLLDDDRFTDVNIHVIPKQESAAGASIEEHRKSPRGKRSSLKQSHPSCSSCHCSSDKVKSNGNCHEQPSDQHEHSSGGKTNLEKDSGRSIEKNIPLLTITGISKDNESSGNSNDTRLCSISSTRRATRSTTSMLSRLAQTSTENSASSSSVCSTSSSESSASVSKRCSCSCHSQDVNHFESDFHIDLQQSQAKYSQITPLATFRAHQAVLMARSSAFASQIRSYHQYHHHHLDHGSNHNLKSPPIDVYIDDLEIGTVRAMLVYIYTGRLPLSYDELNTSLNPIDLFRAAVKFNLQELRDLAKSTMLEVLKIENAIEMLEVSDEANDLALKEQVFTFIRSNASAVSKTTDWFNISKRHPHLIIDAFRSLVGPTTSSNKNNSNPISQHSTSFTTTSKYSKSD